MPELLLNSLEIKNFRAFKHLEIKALGRVNLIVGKNNIGKTCVLEALRLYASRGAPRVINYQLEKRNETKLPFANPEFTYLPIKRPKSDALLLRERAKGINAAAIFKHLLYSRPDTIENGTEFTIGPVAEPERALAMVFTWEIVDDQEPQLKFLTKLGQRRTTAQSAFGFLGSNRSASSTLPNEIPATYIPALGVATRQLEFWYDQSVIENKRKLFLQALQLVDSSIEDIEFIRYTDVRSEYPGEKRTPFIKLKTIARFVPLKSLGDGLSQVFAIALGLLNAQNGFLLIDEFENGLHHSNQLALWRFITQLAQQLNVQVFATTHSNDCVAAFNEATKESPDVEGVLIRLGRRGDNVVSTLYDEEELGIATKHEIEVR